MKDLIILCDGSRIEEIEEFLHLQFLDDPAISILSSGTTERYGLGIIIIEYEQEPPADLRHLLRTDTDIFDYLDAFEVPTYYEESSASDEEQEC